MVKFEGEKFEERKNSSHDEHREREIRDRCVRGCAEGEGAREGGGDFKAECVLHGCNGRCERDRINCFSPVRHHPFFRGLIEEQSFNFAEFTPPACIDRSSLIE